MTRGAAAIVPLESMLQPGSQASTRPTGLPEIVAVPPLAVGRHMLERIPVHEEPPDASWRDAQYLSVNPFVAAFDNVTVHTHHGIVRTRQGVVAETLRQTDETAGYTRDGDRIVLPRPDTTRLLSGRVLSLLGGNHGNLYHWTMECIGRLAAADAEALDGCAALLAPASSAALLADSLRLMGLDRRWPIVGVRAADALRVERLIVPWTMTGHHRPHPALRPFFAAMTAAASAEALPPQGGAWPRRLYVDRRGSALRRLENETEIVDALAARGFAAVRLETLTLAAQIALFAHAEAIVAPHGAGLTHLIHAGPGCRVIELHMDQWVGWCFRRLAAIGGLTYDCVIGRVKAGEQPAWVHARSWSVSPIHVLAAVDRALTESDRSHAAVLPIIAPC